MADDERLNLRDLPPVPAIDAPERISQTLARYFDRCPRSAYLYLKHRGGAPSHAMDRGSLVHLFAEWMVLELLRTGHKTLYEAEFSQVGDTGVVVAEDVRQAQRQLSVDTGTRIDELLEEHPELVVRQSEVDAARTMAYHLAVGFDVDPESVVGIERKFVLELENGWVISGKIDLASLPDELTGQVDDYKTSFHVQSEEEFKESFQTKLYAVLLVFGRPVDRVDCGACREGKVVDHTGTHDCSICKGRGSVEELGEPVGSELRWVRAREVYPRAKLQEKPDGRLVTLKRDHVLSRQELVNFRQDLERLARRFERALETRKWQAVPSMEGGYCNECPAQQECPLPAQLRSWAGSVDSHAKAAEALAWADRMGARVKKTRAEVKAWAGENGPVVVGDALFAVEAKTGRAMKKKGSSTDWDGLTEALGRAAELGEKFDLAEWILPTVTNSFGKVKDASPELVEARRREVADDGRQDDGEGAAGEDGAVGRRGDESGGGDELGERFGDDAPF